MCHANGNPSTATTALEPLMSKSKRAWRPLIFFPGLVFCNLAAFMGALVLKFGINNNGTPCGRLCGFGFAIQQYFGQLAYERAVAVMCFVAAAVALDIAIRQGLRDSPSAQSGKKRRQR